MLLFYEMPVCIFATLRPGNSALDRDFLYGQRCINMRTIVETHHNIAIIAHLKLDGFLRRQMKLAARSFRFEHNAVFAQGAKLAILLDQRVRLKAARIGNDGARPSTHAVQVTQRVNRRRPWSLHQVKRVHDQRGRLAIEQINGVKRAYNTQRGVRHEDRHVQRTMRKGKHSSMQLITRSLATFTLNRHLSLHNIPFCYLATYIYTNETAGYCTTFPAMGNRHLQ